MKTILAYADVVSVRPGDTVQFMVSCEHATTFQADFVRIICGDDGPTAPGYKDEPVDTPSAGNYPGRKQAINAGSYVRIPHGAVFDTVSSFSVQAYVYPTLPEVGPQAVIAKLSPDGRTGFALMIDDRGSPALELHGGDNGVERHSTGKALTANHWAFLGVSYDAESGAVTIHQEPLKARFAPPPWEGRSSLRALPHADGPLTMGAMLTDGRIIHALNGRIDSPRMANRALDRAEMAMIIDPSLPLHLQGALVGAWDFSREIMSDRVVDLSLNRLHGAIVNQPARAVKGYNWSGEVHDWKSAPDQYGAIHFHDDDMIDAQWMSDVAFEVPARQRSGFYAARFSVADDEAYVPFFVRTAQGAAAEPIAVLASTATYLAYGNYQFHMADPSAEKQAGVLTIFDPSNVYLYEHPEIGPSAYDHHSDGSPCMYTSRLRPLFNVAPKIHYWSFNADTHLTDWMEAAGFNYDVITDDDIHREGLSALTPYRAVVTGAHPEYWSTPMWQAMAGFLDDGGRLMYLGGNGFYWRTAYHPDNPAIIEVRRAETGERYWVAEPGEYYHSFTGEYGGLWRRIGIAPNTLVGAGTVATGYDAFRPYRRTGDSYDPRAAFIFDGIGDDEIIGDFDRPEGGVAGIELDAGDHALGTPLHTLVVARSFGHTAHMRLALEETVFHHQPIDGEESDKVCAELLFFECGDGGAVFTTGSIAWCGGLSHNGYDNNVSRLTGNVLRRFADPAPL